MVNRIDIEVNAIGNFAQLKTQLAELKTAVAAIHSKPLLGNFGKEATMQVGAAQKAFDKAIISTRAFNMEMVKMSSHVDEFGMRMQSGQLKFGEYFKLYRQNVKGVASQLDELAASQARVAKSMVIPDALRTGYARVITNTTADLKTLGAAEEAAAIKAKLLNTTIHGMGTQLVNLGKNTQWAGRQLSMGLTMPIVAFGTTAAKTFKDVNVELTKLQRLYGVGVTPPSDAEIKKISDQALKLGKDIAQTMGIAQKETVKTAADFAAIGLEGDKLLIATEQAMKLSKLGSMTAESAQETIVALQNVFKVSSTDLPDAANFLNSIQKQTSLSLQDISDAIPRVGPIIQQLGGSYKDASIMMVAMKEAGIPAAQSANAIKSAISSMIAPTSAASEMFDKFGISLSSMKKESQGNPIKMIEALQKSMSGLDQLSKAQLIEKLFGKFQFARVTALLENLGKAGSQTKQAFTLAGATTSELATLTDQEMRLATESVSSRWQRAVEGMKAQLQPFGESFVKFGTKVVDVIEKILGFLNKFKPLRNLLVTVLGGAALVGPLLMIVGLMGNFVGSLVKGAAFVRMFGAGLKDGGIKTALSGLADGWKMIDKGSLAATESADMFETSVMKSTEAFSTLNFEVEKLKDKLMAIAAMTANGITTKFSPVAALGQYPASQNTLEEMQKLHPYYGGGYTVKNIERPHMSPAAKTWGGWQANEGGIQQRQPGLAAFMSDTSRFPKGLPQQEAWMKHGTSEQWGMPVPVGGLAGTLQKAYSDEPVIHGPKFGTQKSDVIARGMAHIESIRARIINGDIAADSLVARELEKIDALPDDVKQKELISVIEQVTFTEKQYFENMIETFVQTKAILVADEEQVAALDATMKGILADSSIADKPAAFQAAMTAFNQDFVRFGGTLVEDVAAYRQIVTQTIMAGQTEFETAIAAAALRAGLVTEAEVAGGSKAAAFGAFKSMDKHVLEQSLVMGARHVPKGFQEGGIPRFQSGVTSPWVPGSGSGDKIPAMLEPGEFVINRNAAQKYGGLLTDINFNKAPRFQTGGIPGYTQGLTEDPLYSGKNTPSRPTIAAKLSRQILGKEFLSLPGVKSLVKYYESTNVSGFADGMQSSHSIFGNANLTEMYKAEGLRVKGRLFPPSSAYLGPTELNQIMAQLIKNPNLMESFLNSVAESQRPRVQEDFDHIAKRGGQAVNESEFRSTRRLLQAAKRDGITSIKSYGRSMSLDSALDFTKVMLRGVSGNPELLTNRLAAATALADFVKSHEYNVFPKNQGRTAGRDFEEFIRSGKGIKDILAKGQDINGVVEKYVSTAGNLQEMASNKLGPASIYNKLSKIKPLLMNFNTSGVKDVGMSGLAKIPWQMLRRYSWMQKGGVAGFQRGGIPGFVSGGPALEEIWGDGQSIHRSPLWQGPRLQEDYGFMTRLPLDRKHPFFATEQEAIDYRREFLSTPRGGQDKIDLREVYKFTNDETTLKALAEDWQLGPKKIRNYPEKLQRLLSFFSPTQKEMILRRKTMLGIPGEMPEAQQVSILKALASGSYDSIIGKSVDLLGKPSAYTEWNMDWLLSREFHDHPLKMRQSANTINSHRSEIERLEKHIANLQSPNKGDAAYARDQLVKNYSMIKSADDITPENIEKLRQAKRRILEMEIESQRALSPMGIKPQDVILQRLFGAGTSMLDITGASPQGKYRGTKLMEKEWLANPGQAKIESISQSWIPPEKYLGAKHLYPEFVKTLPYVLNMKQRGGIQGYQKGGGPGFAEGLTSAAGLTDFREAHIRRRSVEGTSAYHGEQHIELLYDYGKGKGVTLHLMKTEPSGYPALLDSELVGKWQVAELLNNGAPQTAAIEALTHGRQLLRMQGEDLSSLAIAELGSYSDHSIGMVDRARKSGMLNMTDDQRADIGRNSYTKTLGAQKVNGLADWANNKMSDWSKTEFLPNWKNAYRTLKAIPFAAQMGGGIKGYQNGGGPGFAEGLTDSRKAYMMERSYSGFPEFGAHNEEHLKYFYDYGDGKGVTLHLIRRMTTPGLPDDPMLGKWVVEQAMNNGAPQTATIEAMTHARSTLLSRGQDFSTSAIREIGSYSSHSIGMIDQARKMGVLNITDEERLNLKRNDLQKANAQGNLSIIRDQATSPSSQFKEVPFLANWKKEFVAMKGIPFAAQSGANVPWVPGSGDGDKVPAMLEPGEFVVNKKAAAKHADLLSHINWNDAPRFATGFTGGMRVSQGAQELLNMNRAQERGLMGKGAPGAYSMMNRNMEAFSRGMANTITPMQAYRTTVIRGQLALQDLSAKGVSRFSAGMQRVGGLLNNIGGKALMAGRDYKQGIAVGSGMNLRQPTRSEMLRFGQTSPLPAFGTPANMYGRFGEFVGKASVLTARDIANAGKKLSTSLLNGAKSIGNSLMIASKQIIGSAKQWYSQGMTFKQGMTMGQGKQGIWTGNYVPGSTPMTTIDRRGNAVQVTGPDGKPIMGQEKEMRKARLSDATGVRGKAGFMWGKQAGGGIMGMMGGQMAGMAGMQMTANMQDGMTKSTLSGASMGAMMGGMIPGLGPVGGAMIGAIAGGAMKAFSQWKEKIKNQSDLLTDALTVDSVAMKHLGVTARDFSNIVYNASGKIIKSSSEFQQGVQDYKTSEDPLIASALKGLSELAQGGDLVKIKELMTSRFGGQFLATNGSPEARKKMYTDMQQFMVAGNVGTLTRQEIVSGYKGIKSPQEALASIVDEQAPRKVFYKENWFDKTIGKANKIAFGDNTASSNYVMKTPDTGQSASSLWSMQTTADPLQLGKAFDEASPKTKTWMNAINRSQLTWTSFKDIVKKSDPAMAELDTHMHNLGVTTLQVTRINSLYQSGLAQMTDEQLKEIKANPILLSGLELEAAARQSVNSTFSEYLANAQAHDAQMATQNSAEQKAADAAQAEQDRLNSLIDGVNKYVDSEQKKINKIQKEKAAYDNLMAAQEQSIQNENTLNNLKSAVTRARAGGDLLSMANAQSNYNAELQKQADEKAKQAKDADYDKMMEKHQNNIDGAQKKIDIYNAKLRDLEKATTNAAKVAGENWNIIASKATPATDAVNEINDSVYGTAMQGGWSNAQELYEKVLGEDSGMAGKLKKAGMKAADLKTAIFDFAKSASGTEMQNANDMIGNFGDKLDGIANKSKKLQVAQMLQATLTAQIASGKLTTKAQVDAAVSKNLTLIEEFYNVTDVNSAENKAAKEGSKGIWNGKKIVLKGGKWYEYNKYGMHQEPLTKQPKHGNLVYTNSSKTDIYKLADGGFLRGPGGPKSDMIPAMLSNGEYVVNADAVGRYGTGFMDMINAKKFANGGPVMNDYLKSDKVHHQEVDGWKWDKKQKKYILPTIKPKSIAALNSVKPKNLTRMFDTSAMNKSIRLSGQAGAGTFNSTINDHTVYNITVNAKTGANPQDIAKMVMGEIQKTNKSLGTGRKKGASV